MTATIDQMDDLLRRLADGRPARVAARDAPAAQLASGMMYVLYDPRTGEVLLTANGRNRLLRRGWKPPQHTPKAPPIGPPLGGLRLWALHGLTPLPGMRVFRSQPR